MKDLMGKIGTQGSKVLLFGILAVGLTACGHEADTKKSQLPKYEVPSNALVMRAPPPSVYGRYGSGGVPMAVVPSNYPGAVSNYPSVPGNYAVAQPDYSTGEHKHLKSRPGYEMAQRSFSGPNTVDASHAGYASTSASHETRAYTRADGSRVIQQAPITVKRPSIVVQQDPIWVGNPPRRVSQPPVVIPQPSLRYDQPSVIVRPPQVEFSAPINRTPMVMPAPMTAMPISQHRHAPAPQRSAYKHHGHHQQGYTQHAYKQQGYPQASQYQRNIPAGMSSEPSQAEPMNAPQEVIPTQPGPEDYLPPK
ncbi:MAG: hypothetical protein HQL71_12660 [Magnetococcales bacterium]|nr:hypothetical protein [Magnetococcales bacterium]